MPSRKTQGWEIRLSDFIEEMRGQPFKRGAHDCAMFAGRCAEVMTEQDFTSLFVGDYETKKQAYAFLKKLGIEGLSAIPEKMGCEPLSSPMFAKRGDGVLIEFEFEGEVHEALGIVDMSGRRAVTVGLEGLAYYNMKHWSKAWEI